MIHYRKTERGGFSDKPSLQMFHWSENQSYYTHPTDSDVCGIYRSTKRGGGGLLAFATLIGFAITLFVISVIGLIVRYH